MQSNVMSLSGSIRAFCLVSLVSCMTYQSPAFCQEKAPAVQSESPVNSGQLYSGRVGASRSTSGHPKLRKFARIAAIGALTGGLGGLVLGGSLITHAITGASTRTAITAVREKHKHN